jgi:hypothetical protein
MIEFEREFLATERMRERLVYAEHERMARDARRAKAGTSGPGDGVLTTAGAMTQRRCDG